MPDRPAIHHELPLYIQITEALRREILSGNRPPHSKLPSEHELAQMFGVARATVRCALARLQDDGLTYGKRAVGNFVAEPKIDQDLDRLFGFSELMVYRGFKPGSRLLGTELRQVSSVDSPLLRNLRLRLGENVYTIRRLRLASGRPLVIANTFLPERLFPGILDRGIDKRSVYQIMHEDYGLKPDEAVQTFECVALAAQEAEILRVPEGSPTLLIERIGYARGIPVEYAVDYYRGDSTKFRVRLGDAQEKRNLHIQLDDKPRTAKN